MKLFDSLREKERMNEAFALLTIISTKGTVSRKEGRMAVFKDGTTLGTIGGGRQEAECVEKALTALRVGKGGEVSVKVRECGEMSVMIDIPIKDRSVVIIGAGHVSKALYDMFSFLEWNITIIDEREELLTSSRFLNANRILSSVSDGFKNLVINSNTAIINTIPETIDSTLPLFISSPCFYIGILSSRKRRIIEQDKRIHLPMGLDMGEETVEEIALSVASEVLSTFNKKSAISHRDWKKKIVIVRGAGDLATGTIVRLRKAGYKIIALETDYPTVIRRNISFASALYEGDVSIEGVRCHYSKSLEEALSTIEKGEVALLVDKKGESINELKPEIVVDAIIAKKNLGTTIDMAPFVVALGPGFVAGIDCDCVIETMRGHKLGQVYYSGSALENTGIPGIIGGVGKERVIYSENSGVFKEVAKIGDIVEKGEVIAYVDSTPVFASISGKLRGLLHSDLQIPKGFKIADIDPRGESVDHTTISDKARAIGGAVLEAIDNYLSKND